MKNPGGLKVTAHGDLEIVMTRDFDAPRDLIFDAWTKPDLLKRWLGVRAGWSLAICEVDLKVGGAYRFVWRKGPDGPGMVMRGVYREIVPPERLVCTERFDDPWFPGESLNTLVLIEQGGRTTLTSTSLYESREARDVVLKSPMESGVAESFNVLEKLLASIAGGTGRPRQVRREEPA